MDENPYEPPKGDESVTPGRQMSKADRAIISGMCAGTIFVSYLISYLLLTIETPDPIAKSMESQKVRCFSANWMVRFYLPAAEVESFTAWKRVELVTLDD